MHAPMTKSHFEFLYEVARNVFTSEEMETFEISSAPGANCLDVVAGERCFYLPMELISTFPSRGKEVDWQSNAKDYAKGLEPRRFSDPQPHAAQIRNLYDFCFKQLSCDIPLRTAMADHLKKHFPILAGKGAYPLSPGMQLSAIRWIQDNFMLVPQTKQEPTPQELDASWKEFRATGELPQVAVAETIAAVESAFDEDRQCDCGGPKDHLPGGLLCRK